MTLPTDPFLVREILPDNVKPLHYDVHLTPNLETFEFKGVIAVRYPRLFGSDAYRDCLQLANRQRHQ